jgi:hypothetical protein
MQGLVTFYSFLEVAPPSVLHSLQYQFILDSLCRLYPWRLQFDITCTWHMLEKCAACKLPHTAANIVALDQCNGRASSRLAHGCKNLNLICFPNLKCSTVSAHANFTGYTARLNYIGHPDVGCTRDSIPLTLLSWPSSP